MPVSLPDLPYDILHDICRMIYQCNWSDGSLKNFSVTCKAARGAASSFLFRRIAIDHGWDVDGLRTLHDFNAIKTHVRILDIILRSRTVDYAARLGMWQQRHAEPLPVARVRKYFDVFLHFLGSLRHLEDLTIHDRFVYDAEVMSSFRAALQRCPVHLPNVRVLRISDATMPLFKVCCGRLEALALDITQPSVLRADWARAPGVVRLELTTLTAEVWDDDIPASELSQAIQQSMPNLRYLALLSGDEYSVETLLPRFGPGLANLHTLALEDLEDLGLDYKEHFDYGMPGIFVDEDAEEREQQRLEAVRRVKRAARTTFPALSLLWVGRRTLFDFTQLAPDGGPDALDALQAVTAYSRDALS